MRDFQLDRVKDISGISGTGLVAEGIEFTDGDRERSRVIPAKNDLSKNMQQLRQVHCAGGHTRIIHNGMGTTLTNIQQENMGHAAITRIKSGETQCQQCHLSKTYWEHFNIPCRFWQGKDARFPR